MTGVRIDKWLWAARFFKTRALAAKACELGRVESRNQPLKPAREVRPGDMLRVRTEGGTYEVEVQALSEVRGPAPVAHTLYRESEASQEARALAAAARKNDPFVQPLRTPGRPSKRDRRLIHRFRAAD
ncbi:MAG: RNA-binding S4 domain-containing protein [Acidobacteriota bacterium]|nr:RNA-binding S4 domain-containing protein [Acidobacteriota bacterium]